MRYKPKSMAALQLALGGLPDRMRVEVDPDVKNKDRRRSSQINGLALESSGSSVEPMSAYEDQVIEPRTQTLQINGASRQATAPTMHAGALADRIRALRTTASRAAAS